MTKIKTTARQEIEDAAQAHGWTPGKGESWTRRDHETIWVTYATGITSIYVRSASYQHPSGDAYLLTGRPVLVSHGAVHPGPGGSRKDVVLGWLASPAKETFTPRTQELLARWAEVSA